MYLSGEYSFICTYLPHIVFLMFLGQYYFTNNPENVTICKGDTTVLHCGNNYPIVSVLPVLIINGTHFALPISPVGLPFQYIITNSSNDTRVMIGPVGEQAIGETTFGCFFPLLPSNIYSATATITIMG